MNYNIPPILSIENLGVVYSKYGTSVVAIDNLTIEPVAKGSWTFLLGGNGSGKSTLLQVIARKNENYTGIVRLNGIDLKLYKSKDLSDTILYINQDPLSCTVDELTVMENLIFATDSTSKKLLENALEKVGLWNHRNHLVKNLSGGQRQILALQVAELKKVSLLLLDEPLASLDSENTTNAIKTLINIWKNGTTIIFICHDKKMLDLPELKESKIIYLSQGKLSNEKGNYGK